MAAVRILRPPAAFEHAHAVPRAQWDALLQERRAYCGVHLPQDCRNLMFFVEDGAANDWLGLGSRERYIRDGLGLEPQLVGWALDGLRQLRPDEAATFDQAVVLGKHGGDRRSQQAKGDRDRRPILKGNSAIHLLARLDRDGKSELAAQVRDGTLPAKTAARMAGIKVDATPLQLLRRAWKRASADERAAFLAEVT